MTPSRPSLLYWHGPVLTLMVEAVMTITLPAAAAGVAAVVAIPNDGVFRVIAAAESTGLLGLAFLAVGCMVRDVREMRHGGMTRRGEMLHIAAGLPLGATMLDREGRVFLVKLETGRGARSAIHIMRAGEDDCLAAEAASNDRVLVMAHHYTVAAMSPTVMQDIIPLRVTGGRAVIVALPAGSTARWAGLVFRGRKAAAIARRVGEDEISVLAGQVARAEELRDV